MTLFPFKQNDACVLLLSDTLPISPKAVCTDSSHSDKVVRGAETLDRQITTVLDGVVAPSWGHVLRHGGGKVSCVYGEVVMVVRGW